MRTMRGAVVLFVVVGILGCDSPPPDGGDAGPDAGPGCPADCDDGVFCNGAEVCVAGECVAEEPACAATERCDEALDRCFPDCGTLTDVDGDGVDALACGGTDCDDSDPSAYPGNVEICDAVDHDEDCDPSTFGARDLDGDGDDDAACCNGETCGTDCNDVAAAIHPGATEACNRFDDDCDGLVDEDVTVDGFADADRDGRGNPAIPMRACAGQNGFSIYGDDCNDANLTVNGVQPELCDSIDNDCDDAVDEGALPVTWYPDLDGDGFGDPRGATVLSCAPVAGRSILATDCADGSAMRSPRAPELCNAIDDDCSDGPDFFAAPGDAEDDDRDGVPDANCIDVTGATDCDDRDPGAAAGQQEICNGRDDDCDGVRDEACVACVTDAHCSGGARCVGNVCEPECGAMGMCPAGRTCCGGACVDTETNGAHCGTCDAQCVLFSAFPACEAGDCVVSRCRDPYEDCDGSDANGCEIDTTRSTLHCGSCGHACMLPHATPTCAMRACRIASCEPGWLDCNGIPEDGCEVDRLSDEASCGTCDHACTPDRGATAQECVSGACQITACEEGRHDCNRSLDDGCEVALLAPAAGCTNVLLAAGTAAYPIVTTSRGAPIAALTDGLVCGMPFDFSGGAVTIDVDLGPGPHAVKRLYMYLAGQSATGSVSSSTDGTTYTLVHGWDAAVPGQLATHDFAVPTDVRYLRFVPGTAYFTPWQVMELEVYECP